MASGESSSGGSGDRPNSPAAPADPIQNARDLLKQIMSVLVAVLLGQPLSPAALKRLQKVRKKAWLLVPRFIDLAIQKPGYAPGGKDPQALLSEYRIVSELMLLVADVSDGRKLMEETLRQRESDLWKSILVIYGIAQAQANSDPEVANLVKQMQAAMSQGPRAQKSVKVAIRPSPRGKQAEKAALAAARAEAGIPDPKAPATHGVAEAKGPVSQPAVSPAPIPVAPSAPAVPSVPSNGAGGSGPASGGAH